MWWIKNYVFISFFLISHTCCMFILKTVEYYAAWRSFISFLFSEFFFEFYVFLWKKNTILFPPINKRGKFFEGYKFECQKAIFTYWRCNSCQNFSFLCFPIIRRKNIFAERRLKQNVFFFKNFELITLEAWVSIHQCNILFVF